MPLKQNYQAFAEKLGFLLPVCKKLVDGLGQMIP